MEQGVSTLSLWPRACGKLIATLIRSSDPQPHEICLFSGIQNLKTHFQEKEIEMMI